MIIVEQFTRVAGRFANQDMCLEAAREFQNLVEGRVSLIIKVVGGGEDKFKNEAWPFHAVVIGYEGGKWFGGAPGSGRLHFGANLGEILTALTIEFGGLWPEAGEIEKAIIESRREIEIHSEDWVC